MRNLSWQFVVLVTVAISVVGALIYAGKLPESTIGTIIAAVVGYLVPSPLARGEPPPVTIPIVFDPDETQPEVKQ